MKSYLVLIVVAVSAFLVSGCYTQLQYSSPRYLNETPEGDRSQIQEREVVRSYPFYYKNYEAADWYARHGFGNYTWYNPYYSSLRYGWWGAPGIAFSLRHDWYRDRYYYTPSYAYWNDYIYYDGFVYRRYRIIDDADVELTQRYAPRTMGTNRLGLIQNRPLPNRSGTFGGESTTNVDISGRSRTLGTNSTTTERERPTRVRESSPESSRTRSTGRSTVNTASDNGSNGSSSGTARSRESDSTTSSGTRSRTQ